MDFVEMEPNAQVTVYNISFYLIFPYFLVDIAPDLNLYKSVMSLISVRQQAQQNEPISIRDVIQWVIKNKLSQRPLDFLN